MTISDGFSCNIPGPQIDYMKIINTICKPMIECEVSDPYKESSVLAENQCYKVNDMFWFLSKVFKKLERANIRATFYFMIFFYFRLLVTLS